MSMSEIRKFECKNIVDSCYYLEHIERYEKQPEYREMDKEMILNEMRNAKLNETYELLKEFEDANDPAALRRIFLYKDLVNQEYESEQRKVTQDFQRDMMDPNRQVAQIEMKGRQMKNSDI